MKFVILDYGSQDHLLEYLKTSFENEIATGRVVVYSYRGEHPFRMAHAKNMAHRLGMFEGADVLVNLDADNYLHDGFEDFVEMGMAMAPGNFLWAGMVRGKGKKFRGVSGRIVVSAKAFIKTGGYDEKKFATWGHDDTDFNQRLTFLGYNPVEIDPYYLECIPHGDGIRFREYPQAQPMDPGAEDRAPMPGPTAVANFGNIGCGEVWNVQGNYKVVLEPIPTRIFGIGLHKTATSSLHAALGILGYESAHWESGGWARDVYNEMLASKTSPTLERFYAASDLPISILYRELDHAYPGSKFILTIRDESEWLRSVRDHFSYKNPFRWEWDHYPISNRIHQAVYGRKDFDAQTMLERYRRHNAEVLDYFVNRSDDLLVMKEPKWTELCKFLGRPIPNVDYPHQFRTRL